MEEQILIELKQIRYLLSQLIGTSDLPANQKFSKDALEKASKEFKKLSISRGEWLETHEIYKVIRNAPYQTGKILIERFGFTNYFIKGKTRFFNKKDLKAFNNELKLRNIDLKKYIELLEDQAKFEKYVSRINLPKGTKTKKHYKIPDGLKDITSKPYTPPSEEIVRKEIETYFDEFNESGLSEYVDLFSSKTYAMFKFIYAFDRYLDLEIKKRCKSWCFKFNYANDALKKILELKEENVI